MSNASRHSTPRNRQPTAQYNQQHNSQKYRPRHTAEYKTEYNEELNMNIYYNSNDPVFKAVQTDTEISLKMPREKSTEMPIATPIATPTLLPEKSTEETKHIVEIKYMEIIIDSYLWEYPEITREFKAYVLASYKAVKLTEDIHLNKMSHYKLLRAKYIEIANQYKCPKLLMPEQCDSDRGENRLKSILKYVINRQPRGQAKILPTCYLDIGCFDGGITHAIAQHFNLHKLQTHGVDIKEYPNTNITFTLYDGKTLPYSDNSFDLITCLMVLHHIPSENLAVLLSEINRIMKPNGVIILREHDVNNPNEKILLDLMHDFYDYVWKDTSADNIDEKSTEKTIESQWITNYNSNNRWAELFNQTGFESYTQPNIFRDKIRNPFMSYLCSYYKPAAGASLQRINMFRIIPDDLPREQYKRRTKEIKSVLHWGQRKLLLTEIEFFTLFMSKLRELPHNDLQHNGMPKQIYAIYAGSAPGTHILYLTKLFPEIHFELYDPREFSRKLFKNKEMIKTYVQYFTDDTAGLWISSNHPDKLILLISDIRTGEPEKQSPAMVEERVKIDHEWQKSWYHIMRPEMAMFKFRLPWNDEITEYLAGDIYIQPYPPATSTETRLIIGKDVGLKLYDNRKYEEQFFHFNNHMRPANFNNLLYDIKSDQKHGLSNNYDSAVEVYILQKYLEMKMSGGIKRGCLTANPTKKIQQIIKMIRQISNELSNIRTMYSKQPVKDHKKNMLIRLQQLGYIPHNIALDQSTFDIYVIPRYDFFKEQGLLE